MLPNPREIFRQFESGELEREEMHALMAVHARELIREMEDDHLNPVAALWESLQARRLAAKLARRHGQALVREVMTALAALPDSPFANAFWNASHPDVPLHCFLRIARKPVLRIEAMRVEGKRVEVEMQYGEAGGETIHKRKFVFERDAFWNLRPLANGSTN